MWGLEEKRLLLGWWGWRAATAMGSWSDACGGSVTCSILGRLKEVRKLRHRNACRTCYYFISLALNVVKSVRHLRLLCNAHVLCAAFSCPPESLASPSEVLLGWQLCEIAARAAQCCSRGLWAGGIQTYFCEGELSPWRSLSSLLFKECLYTGSGGGVWANRADTRRCEQQGLREPVAEA